MGLLDDALRDVAQSLVTTFGTDPVTITRHAGDYDPFLGEEQNLPETVTVPMSPPKTVSKALAGTPVQAGDLEAIVSAKDLGTFVPTVGTDSLTFNGKAHTLVFVKATYSGDQVAIYTLSFRS